MRGDNIENNCNNDEKQKMSTAQFCKGICESFPVDWGCEDVPKVMQGNWYDSRIGREKVLPKWSVGYDLQVEWRGETRFYKVVDEQICKWDQEVIVLKQIPWATLSEKERAQIILDFLPEVSEEELMGFVYGKNAATRMINYAKEEKKWAEINGIHSPEITLKVVNALGSRFTTVECLTKRYLKDWDSVYKVEYLVDGKWLVIVCDSDLGEIEARFEIKDYKKIQEAKARFRRRVAVLSQVTGVPWEIACLVGTIENDLHAQRILKSFVDARYDLELCRSCRETTGSLSECVEKIIGSSTIELLNLTPKKMERLGRYLLNLET